MNVQEIENLKNNARNNDPDAQFKLYQILREGKEIKNDDREAFDWLTKAAKNKQSEACYELSECYFSGYYKEKNHKMALTWLKEAISLKNEKAYTKMAILLLVDLNKEKKEITDELQTIQRYFRAAAIKNEPVAQFNLGLLYKIGVQGIHVDNKEALRWIEKSANLDNVDAQTELGYFFAYGTNDGVIKVDEDKAIYWWEKASKNGSIEAQYNLAVVYAKKAQRNWESAAKKGDEKSRYMLNRLDMLNL